MYPLKVKKLHNFPKDKEIVIPSNGDVGIDLYCAEDVFVHNGSNARIKTGIAVELPPGFWLLAKDRSSKAKLYEVNAGVIDQPYRGEILLSVRVISGGDRYYLHPGILTIGDNSKAGVAFKKGDKIGQMIICRSWNNDFQINYVQELSETDRGEGGFGSTGA